MRTFFDALAVTTTLAAATMLLGHAQTRPTGAAACVQTLQQHHAYGAGRDRTCHVAEQAARSAPHRARYNCLESMHRSGLDPALGQSACAAATTA